MRKKRDAEALKQKITEMRKEYERKSVVPIILVTRPS